VDASRIPVVVTAGQAIERDEVVTSLDLVERAVAAALAGPAGALSKEIERVSMMGALFSPGSPRPASDAAERLHLEPKEREVTAGGGNLPQWLVTRAAGHIADGSLQCTLIAGAESARSFRAAGGGEAGGGLFRAPVLDDDSDSDTLVGRSAQRYISPDEQAVGIRNPTTLYPLFESSRAAEAGRTFAEQRQFLGPLMSRFTRIAARHPYAWFPQEATADELATPTERNRLISEPYPKRMNSFPFVDQAAAVVVCSLAAAERAGLADQAVFIWSGADAAEVIETSQRPELGHSAGMRAAAGRAFEAAGNSVDDMALFDFYSCFPVAVQMAAEAVGVALDDERGLTVTGGLPYFGGPGNNYVTHAIATMTERLRENGGLGLCLGMGGFNTKFSACVYGATPPPNGFRRGDTSGDQAAIDATALPVTATADGLATVDAGTVTYDHTGAAQAAPVIASLADGTRVAAAADTSALQAAAGQLLVGRKVHVSGAPLTWRFDQ
jgi:acetyl-CoA C-acetyltransferase